MKTNPAYTPVELLPHDPPLILIDHLESIWDSGASAQATVRPSWPLFEKGSVPIIVLIEVLAQTAGLWAGWKQIRDNTPVRIGYLVGIKNAVFSRQRLPEGLPVSTRAETIVKRYNFSILECRADTGGEELAVARMQFTLAQASGDAKTFSYGS